MAALKPLATPTSPNIIVFDYSVQMDLHNLLISLADISTYQSGGAANVQGINFLITSPSGTVIWSNTSLVTPDIDPATPAIKNVAIPTFGTAIEYGNYNVTGTITDQNGTQYVASCPPILIVKPLNGCSNGVDGLALVQTSLFCAANKLSIADTTVYTYNKTEAASVAYAMVLTYPTSAGLDPATINVPFVSYSPVYNGDYFLSVANVATYNYGNSVTVLVTYVQDNTVEARCYQNLCQFECALTELIRAYDVALNTNQSIATELEIKIAKVCLLMLNAQNGIACGKDVSKAIKELERLLKIECKCGCGTSVDQGALSSNVTNFIFTKGCGQQDENFTTSQIGSTYYINYTGKTYEFEGNAGITITKELSGCTYTVTIDIFVDDLITANDYIIPQINPSNINDNTNNTVSGGNPLSDILTSYDAQFGNVRLYLQTLTQSLINDTTPETFKKVGAGGNMANGQPVPNYASPSFINTPTINAPFNGSTISFKQNDIGRGLYIRKNLGNIVDVRGVVQMNSVSDGLALVFPTGYIPVQQITKPIEVIYMNPSGNFIEPTSYSQTMAYVLSSGNLRINLDNTVAFTNAMAYLDFSFPID